MPNILNEQINKNLTAFEIFFREILAKSSNQDTKLYQAICYTCLNGGKRIRPMLVYLAAEFLDIPKNSVNYVAAAIELIHCYSIIHDDLPAMDDDDMRRGKPALHIAYNEGIAILAGDAMQSLAFEVLALNPYLPAEVKSNQTVILAQSCGLNGMTGGQLIDLEATNKTIHLEELVEMHNLKTGKLFMSTILMVCSIIENSKEKRSALKEYASSISLAFQIQDDILDIESSSEILGKPAQSDLKNNKSTYCTILGIEQAKEEVNKLHNKAIKAISNWPESKTNLENFASFLLKREY